MNHDDGLTVVLSRRQLLLHPHLLLGRKLFLELPQPVFRVFSVFFLVAVLRFMLASLLGFGSTPPSAPRLSVRGPCKQSVHTQNALSRHN